MKNRTIASFLWRLAERCGAQGVSFIVTIVIARIVEPEQYGIIAIVTICANILQVFVDSGMGSSLIQKKDADNLDFSTVFFFNIIMCCGIYLFIFLAAPFIADIYNNEMLTIYIRVFSVNVLISGVKNIQQAYVSKHLLFKKFFFATLGGTITSAFIGISMAYLGFGCWALIAQILSNSLIDTVILWLTVSWRPNMVFSFNRLKGLFSFGWKLLISSLIETLYSNLTNMLIGKFYSTKSLAYYNKGFSFPNLIVQNINSSLDSILLPTMSEEQDNITKVKSIMRRSLRVSSYLLSPLLIGLFAVADVVISLLLTDKWLPCVPFLRIFCLYFLIYPVHTANLNAINAIGRSDIFLKLEIVKKIIGLTVILITINVSPFAMAIGMLIVGILSHAVNAYPNYKLLHYGYFEQLKDIFPNILLATLMGCCVYPIRYLDLPLIVTLIIQIPLGAVFYIGGSFLLKYDSFEYIWNIVKPMATKVLHRD